MRQQTFVRTPSIQSPNSEEWRILCEDANNVSSNFAEHGNKNTSSSNTYNDAVNPPTEGFYRLSQQQPESDLSVSSSILSEKDNTDKNQKSRRPRINPDKPAVKSVKGGKKVYKSLATGKVRESRRTSKDRNKDNISSSSSSYQQQRRTKNLSYRSGNNMTSEDNINQNTNSCGHNQQHSSHFCHTCSHENITSPKSFQKNSTCSKQSGGCDGNTHHYHNHQRPRNRHINKNMYHPSVIQLYPPIKDIQQVVLNGVVNQTARGETVMAVGTVSKQRDMFSDARSDMVSEDFKLQRQNTYIKDDPSPELLQSMTSEESRSMVKSSRSFHSLSPAPSRMSVKTTGHNNSISQKGSMLSVRSQPASMSTQIRKPSKGSKKSTSSETASKNKGGKMWKGLKKLLSPSEDSKSFDKNSNPNKVKSPKKNRHTGSTKKGSRASNTGMVSNSKLAKTDVNSKSTTNSKQDIVASHNLHNSDSLSLSSSSASNQSFNDNENNLRRNERNPSATLPFGHIPSKDTRAEVNRPLQHTVWRRTPPVLDPEDYRYGDIVNKNWDYSDGTKSAAINHTSRTTSQMSIASKASHISAKSDVWIYKEGKQKITQQSGISASQSFSVSSKANSETTKDPISPIRKESRAEVSV